MVNRKQGVYIEEAHGRKPVQHMPAMEEHTGEEPKRKVQGTVPKVILSQPSSSK